MVYWNGLRSCWYLVKAGETLNREGETGPWPQMFIILKGRGRARVHYEEFEIETKTAIYIPKDSIPQIFAEEDVELIWISWQSY